MTKNFWKKSALCEKNSFLKYFSILKTGRSVTPRTKKSQKTLFFRRDKKNVTPRTFFVHLEKFFFSPPEILSILHAWHPGHFLVIFLEKFMIFCKWTKKFFFNVNPYHFQTHAWHPGHKKKFFSKGICQLLVFFFPKKKKKNFFFPGPKILKKPCEEPTKWSKNHHFAGFYFGAILRPFLESTRCQ